MRAKEYEAIYKRDDPARLEEQLSLANLIKNCFKGQTVPETACGTGYWTRYLAETAEKVTAIDSSPEMLKIAQAKYLGEHVKFVAGNAYDLKDIPGKFSGGMACFWFSQVPKAMLSEFLGGFRKKLSLGSVLMFTDNNYIPGV